MTFIFIFIYCQWYYNYNNIIDEKIDSRRICWCENKIGRQHENKNIGVTVKYRETTLEFPQIQSVIARWRRSLFARLSLCDAFISSFFSIASFIYYKAIISTHLFTHIPLLLFQHILGSSSSSSCKWRMHLGSSRLRFPTSESGFGHSLLPLDSPPKLFALEISKELKIVLLPNLRYPGRFLLSAWSVSVKVSILNHTQLGFLCHL